MQKVERAYAKQTTPKEHTVLTITSSKDASEYLTLSD